jgi:DNA polymerase I-like protein with 3'-5' exonuclease and polymerase domains
MNSGFQVMPMTNFPNLDGQIIAFDTETTGLGPTDAAFGFSVACGGWSGYFDIRETPKALLWLSECRPERIVAHNASFDYRMITRAGAVLDLNLFDDTVIRACLINEHLPSYSLDELAARYLGDTKQSEIYGELARLFGGRATRNVQMKNISRAPAEVVGPYAIKDAELTLKLWWWQEEEIQRQGIEQIVEFERDLMPTLIRAEMRGIRVDLDVARKAQEDLTIELDRQQREINEIAGKSFNVNSTPQVREMFKPYRDGDTWISDGGVILESTDNGGPCLNSEALRKMEGDPRADLILSIRSLIKTRDTFLGGHVIESAHNGRVYPTINQNKGEAGGTGTGRLSYTGPAMQQIPSRNKKVAAIVKPVFLPELGQVWVDADMASFEVRVFAHFANDPAINQLYRDDPSTDFHQAVADLTGLPRNAAYSGQPNAKQLNLSMIFNAGNGAIADKMGMEWWWDTFTDQNGKEIRYKQAGPDALRVIDRYHNTLPGVKKLVNGAKQAVMERGYIFTKYGRRIRFPDKRYAYKASGLLIQSTAADINKNNWKILEKLTTAMGGSLLLNTHDSYSMSLPKDDWEQCWKDIERTIAGAYPWFRVPLVLELSGVGNNWWEAVR